MENRKEDIGNYFGRALFIMLFFLLIAAFSDRSVKQSNDPVQYEFVAESITNSAQAVSPDAVQLPLFYKEWISFVDKMSIHFFNENFKITADNKNIAQRLNILHQTELVIKPLTICRFYTHHFPIEAEELPVLS